MVPPPFRFRAVEVFLPIYLPISSPGEMMFLSTLNVVTSTKYACLQLSRQ